MQKNVIFGPKMLIIDKNDLKLMFPMIPAFHRYQKCLIFTHFLKRIILFRSGLSSSEISEEDNPPGYPLPRFFFGRHFRRKNDMLWHKQGQFWKALDVSFPTHPITFFYDKKWARYARKTDDFGITFFFLLTFHANTMLLRNYVTT